MSEYLGCCQKCLGLHVIDLSDFKLVSIIKCTYLCFAQQIMNQWDKKEYEILNLHSHEEWLRRPHGVIPEVTGSCQVWVTVLKTCICGQQTSLLVWQGPARSLRPPKMYMFSPKPVAEWKSRHAAGLPQANIRPYHFSQNFVCSVDKLLNTNLTPSITLISTYQQHNIVPLRPRKKIV